MLKLKNHLAEARVAALVNDLAQPLARHLLDDEIGIDKVHAQGFCQHHADGGFAAAGHADEDQVLHGVHAPSCVIGVSRAAHPAGR